MALRVNQENFEKEVLQSTIPVVVEFYSESCIPCKQIGISLSELEEEFEEKIKLVKINVNFDAELAERFKVLASPTILFFQGEKEVQRMIGLTKKAVLKEAIEQII